ncbi:ArsR/SmtB family transcription factor [Rhizobium rhizogenes]|uniref:ArsR/SmtB family transcription factor n=1 Tax=Rhizobium rhizogenes TaxID=359 RepID=UPI0015736BA7|nr:metalloregulator ArsR/SmtB family transcription factor [Rhizobium rhizogenes]NTG45724.1 helix-turn-helix transcriptional regulator [Rhizobium rhizogenes]
MYTDPANGEDEARDDSELLAAMANRHRLLILRLLRDRELSVKELGDRVQLSQSALSQHLAVLRRFNLVKARRCGQNMLYGGVKADVEAILKTLEILKRQTEGIFRNDV